RLTLHPLGRDGLSESRAFALILVLSSSPKSGIPVPFAQVRLADRFRYGHSIIASSSRGDMLTYSQYIDEIALKFPTLKIICGHIGFPWTQEMIGVAWKHPNVFIDTSAYLPKYYPPVTYPSRVFKRKTLVRL